jgi:preprotein translocase SecF subunit
MNIQFFKNRFIFFGISIGLVIIGIISALVNGIALDIQFVGGSVIRYTSVGQIDTAKIKTAVEKAIGEDISGIQVNMKNGEATGIVINVAIKQGEEIALTNDQMAAIRSVLESDEFAANQFTLSEQTTVSASIGAEYLKKGLMALLLAAICIILYVWYSFRSMSGPSAGIFALVALFHDVIMVFIAFIILKIPLNESFIAVALTIIGYSTNDTIVIYDRIRENIRLQSGKLPLAELVDKSINQSLSRTINTAAATFGAVLITYIFAAIFGIRSIQEFALPMLIGIISGFYSTVFIATPLWVTWKTRKGRAGL